MDVEWLIIADAAQVVGGKLYLLGGGYDRVTLPKQPPAPHNMAVAVAFRVSWIETNVKHDFELGDSRRGRKQDRPGERPVRGRPPSRNPSRTGPAGPDGHEPGMERAEARLVRGRGTRQQTRNAGSPSTS